MANVLHTSGIYTLDFHVVCRSFTNIILLKLFKRIRLKIDSLKLYSLKPLIPSLLESQIYFFRLSRPSPTLKPIKPKFHSLDPIRF